MNHKMNVLLVSEYFPPKIMGGGEISALFLAQSLAKKGIDVSVLTSWFKGLKQEENLGKIKVYRLLRTSDNVQSIFGNLKRMFFFQSSLKKELKKLLKKNHFDVVHFLNTTSIPQFKIDAITVSTINGYANFCPKGNLFYKDKEVCSGSNFAKCIDCMRHSSYFGKTKVSWYLRLNPFFWLTLYANFMKRKNALKNMDKFISISDFITAQLLKKNITKNRITKIPNLANTETSGEKVQVPAKGIIVAYFGSLEKIKGTELLVRAFNKIKHKEATLLLLGDGPERQKLEKLAGNNVFFLGAVDYKYIPSLYQQVDIVVLPSLWPEPFSRVCLEATFFGKPLIATDVGGNSEGVIDGVNGFLVKPDVDAMAAALQKVIKNPKLREKLSAGSKQVYKRLFDAEKNTMKTISFYSKKV